MAKYRALILAGGAFLALARAAGAADLLPPPPALEPPPPARDGVQRLVSARRRRARRQRDRAEPRQFARSAARARRWHATPRRPTGFLQSDDFRFRASSTSASAISSTTGSAPTSPGIPRRRDFQSLEVLNEPNTVGANPARSNTPTSIAATSRRGSACSTATSISAPGTAITPYVGAGVGFAYNTLFGFTDTGYAVTIRRHRPDRAGGYSNDGGKWNFAWALMAGLELRRHAEPQARSRLPLSRLRQVHLRLVALLDGGRARLLVRRRQLRRLFEERPRLQRLPHRPALDDRRRATPPPHCRWCASTDPRARKRSEVRGAGWSGAAFVLRAGERPRIAIARASP